MNLTGYDGSFLVATVLVEAFVAASAAAEVCIILCSAEEQPSSLGAAAQVRILLDSGEE